MGLEWVIGQLENGARGMGRSKCGAMEHRAWGQWEVYSFPIARNVTTYYPV